MNLTFRLSKKSRVVSDSITVFEVLARYHSGGFDQYAKTGVFVPSSFTDRNGNKKTTWSDGFIVIPKISYSDNEQIQIKDLLTEAKDRLNEIDANVSKALAALQMRNEAPYKGWLQDVILNKANTEPDDDNEILMLDALSDYIDGNQKASRGTIKRFITMLNALRRYEDAKGVKLTFEELSPEQLQDIREFIRIEEIPKRDDKKNGGEKEFVQRSENYIVSIFRAFRTFVRWANGLSKDYRIEPLTHNNPFELFSIGSEQYGTPYYLTIDERNRLEDAELPPRLARQRDIFIFQCLIGCRVGDLWTMTKKSVIDGAVEYIPRKTKDGRPVTVRVPLNDRAKAIIDRYKDNGDPRLLPFVAQQQYNEDIKEMLKLAKIDRMVTVLNPVTKDEEKKPIYEVASSHMARRTFIGNLYKQVKDPNLVGKLSGHTENSKAFARYRDIDEDMAKELVSMLE